MSALPHYRNLVTALATLESQHAPMSERRDVLVQLSILWMLLTPQEEQEAIQAMRQR